MLFSLLVNIYIYYIPPSLTVHFPMTRSVRYQPILHNLYSSRQKKVPTTYRLFNVVDKKTARFKRSFTSVDVVSTGVFYNRRFEFLAEAFYDGRVTTSLQ